jgi:hypothetical protein
MIDSISQMVEIQKFHESESLKEYVDKINRENEQLKAQLQIAVKALEEIKNCWPCEHIAKHALAEIEEGK